MAIVDDDGSAFHTDLVEAAGREVVVGREAAQALPDVMQRGARCERRRGCRHGVLDVHRGATAESCWQQVGPGQLHGAAAFLDHDHVTKITVLQHDGPSAAPAVIIDGIADLAAWLGHAEPHDPARATSPHRSDQRIVGIEYGKAVPRHRLHNDRFDICELVERVDAAEAQMISLDVQYDPHVVALIPQTFAQDAAACHLEDSEVDPRILQHHLRRPRPRGV